MRITKLIPKAKHGDNSSNWRAYEKPEPYNINRMSLVIDSVKTQNDKNKAIAQGFFDKVTENVRSRRVANEKTNKTSRRAPYKTWDQIAIDNGFADIQAVKDWLAKNGLIADGKLGDQSLKYLKTHPQLTTLNNLPQPSGLTTGQNRMQSRGFWGSLANSAKEFLLEGYIPDGMSQSPFHGSGTFKGSEDVARKLGYKTYSEELPDGTIHHGNVSYPIETSALPGTHEYNQAFFDKYHILPGLVRDKGNWTRYMYDHVPSNAYDIGLAIDNIVKDRRVRDSTTGKSKTYDTSDESALSKYLGKGHIHNVVGSKLREDLNNLAFGYPAQNNTLTTSNAQSRNGGAQFRHGTAIALKNPKVNGDAWYDVEPGSVHGVNEGGMGLGAWLAGRRLENGARTYSDVWDYSVFGPIMGTQDYDIYGQEGIDPFPKVSTNNKLARTRKGDGTGSIWKDINLIN